MKVQTDPLTFLISTDIYHQNLKFWNLFWYKFIFLVYLSPESQYEEVNHGLIYQLQVFFFFWNFFDVVLIYNKTSLLRYLTASEHSPIPEFITLENVVVGLFKNDGKNLWDQTISIYVHLPYVHTLLNSHMRSSLS